MRNLQRKPPVRLALALVAGGLITFLTSYLGDGVVVGLLFVTLTAITFIALTVAPDAIAQYRGHYWRWGWRSSDDGGPYWPGTRIRRSPRS